MKKYDVSIVLLTYNSKFEALKFTIDTILKQRNVSTEIIICDDCSKDNNFNLIEDYFKKRNFEDFTLVANKENQGIVTNLLNGSKLAKADIIKYLSPGDGFYDENSLTNWLSYFKENNAKWSFPIIQHYEMVEGNIKNISHIKLPVNLKPYTNNNYQRCRWNYCVLDDNIVGASIMYDKQTLINYLSKINGKVLFLEDMILRLMMFDGIVGLFYPEIAIYYEFGSGITTGGNKQWKNKAKKDWQITSDIMKNTQNCDRYQTKMLKAIKTRNDKSVFNRLFLKGYIYNNLLYRYRKIQAKKGDNYVG